MNHRNARHRNGRHRIALAAAVVVAATGCGLGVIAAATGDPPPLAVAPGDAR